MALQGPQLTRIVQAAEVEGLVIHPAMVFMPRGGMFQRIARGAVQRDAIRVTGSGQVRRPLVQPLSPALLPDGSAPGIPNRNRCDGRGGERRVNGRGARRAAFVNVAGKNEKPAGQRAFVVLPIRKNLERAKGFEPSTPTLARSCSTTELHPHPRD